MNILIDLLGKIFFNLINFNSVAVNITNHDLIGHKKFEGSRT